MESLYGPLKDIAAALKAIQNKSNTSDKEITALDNIAKKIDRGNTINIETSSSGGQSTAELEAAIRAGLMYSYQSGDVTITKGLATLVKELTDVMLDVKAALSDSTNGTLVAKVKTIADKQASIATNSGTMATKLGLIADDTDDIATNTENSATFDGLMLGYVEDIKKSFLGMETYGVGVSTRLKTLAQKILEGDEMLATAVMRKLATPEAAVIVEGSVNTSTMVFEPADGQQSFGAAATAYSNGQLVMLKYELNSNIMIDMVTYLDDTLNVFKTQNLFYWAENVTVPSLTVDGYVDTHNNFGTTTGVFSTAKATFLQGLPVYLRVNNVSHAVVNYLAAEDKLVTDGPGWMWAAEGTPTYLTVDGTLDAYGNFVATYASSFNTAKNAFLDGTTVYLRASNETHAVISYLATYDKMITDGPAWSWNAPA